VVAPPRPNTFAQAFYARDLAGTVVRLRAAQGVDDDVRSVAVGEGRHPLHGVGVARVDGVRAACDIGS
jgi:hypothetical protein